MKIIIRCDANKEIATGHMKRCMSIAGELVKLGAEVVFAVASESSVSYVDGIYRVIKFNNEYNEPETELPKMQSVLSDEKPDLLLVDSYFVSAEYMSAMRTFTKVAYIDDLYERVWPVDVIINYGIIADSYPYEDDYADSIRLLGPRYMPINQVYKSAKPCVIKEKAENVLVVSGGSDENHVMLNTLKALVCCNDRKDINYTFILGAFNADYDEMTATAKDMPWITIHKSLPTLADIISESDIIVTAGGTTLYEMAILGCPGIIYKLADNQSENIKGFVEKKIALYAGDVRDNTPDGFLYNRLVESIVSLADNYTLRKQLSDRGREIIDANGAERLAEELIKNGR